ncbi:hypothetical protein D3C87_1725470 [compost metagenome]
MFGKLGVVLCAQPTDASRADLRVVRFEKDRDIDSHAVVTEPVAGSQIHFPAIEQLSPTEALVIVSQRKFRQHSRFFSPVAEVCRLRQLFADLYLRQIQRHRHGIGQVLYRNAWCRQCRDVCQ